MLGHLNRLTVEQIDCLKANDQKRLLALDKELETVFGEKERAFGAVAKGFNMYGDPVTLEGTELLAFQPTSSGVATAHSDTPRESVDRL